MRSCALSCIGFWISFILFTTHIFARPYVPGEWYEEGELVKVDVRKLHPTQFSLGMEEVDARKEELRETYSLDEKDIKEQLKKDAGEAVIGPGGKLYLVDGHHHARAHYDLKKYDVYVKIDKDWSDKSEAEFWRDMKNLSGERKRTRVYLKDANGKKRSEKELPKSVAGLKNNPYRSIVFSLIQAGIIDKESGDFPIFGEFKIVDWLRSRVRVTNPSGRSRLKQATMESALLLTDKDNQDAELPGQIKLKKRSCRELLSDWYQ